MKTKTNNLKFKIDVSFGVRECDCLDDGVTGGYEYALEFCKRMAKMGEHGEFTNFGVERFEVSDLNGATAEIPNELKRKFSWLFDDIERWTDDYNEANEYPKGMLKFMHALKKGMGWLNKKRISELKLRLKKLRKEEKSIIGELAKLEDADEEKSNGD